VWRGAGDVCRGRGRAAIDQHDERLTAREVAGMGTIALRFLGVAAAGRDDLATVEEGVRNRDRLVKQAVGVVAKVEDIATHLVYAAKRCLDLVDGCFEPVIGLL